MDSLTYRDIIDDKITEWRKGLVTLEKQAEKATSDTQAIIRPKVRELKAAIDTATVQLYHLDKQETVSNTMETKNEILRIFRSIDIDFTGYEDKTPFML